MRTVPFGEWVEALSQSQNDAEGAFSPEENPAIKLLEFYRQAAAVKVGKRKEGEAQQARMLASQKAERASKTLLRVGAVDEGWVRTWMQQWGLVEESA